MRRILFVVVLLGLIVATWAALRPGSRAAPEPPHASPLGARAPGRDRVTPVPPDERAAESAARRDVQPEFLRALLAALAAADPTAAQDAAAALRLRLRTDAQAWATVAAVIVDPDADARLRGALALVLGTIDAPHTDEVLRGALAGADGDLARALILALGATREPPDDDEIFDLGDRPWGEDGPGGLGITVRRTIEDAATRGALAGVLRSGEGELRRVAAVALRHSMDSDDVRSVFAAVLRDESDDAPLAEVAEAFAMRARTATPEERDAFLRALVERAAESGLDGTRFRVIDDLHHVPLPRDVAARLRELALGDHEFGIRAFALDLLAAAAQSGEESTVATAREVLIRTLELDADAALRDTAARLLRLVPGDDDATQALLRALREDAAWNVRYTALETLAQLAGPARAAAIEAGNRDGDERVRALAAELGSGR